MPFDSAEPIAAPDAQARATECSGGRVDIPRFATPWSPAKTTTRQRSSGTGGKVP